MQDIASLLLQAGQQHVCAAASTAHDTLGCSHHHTAQYHCPAPIQCALNMTAMRNVLLGSTLSEAFCSAFAAEAAANPGIEGHVFHLNFTF